MQIILCIGIANLTFPLLSAQSPSFDGDKPSVTFNSQYAQVYSPDSGWDASKFYGLWDAQEPNIFTATDIASGYLQFEWIRKRVLLSKSIYVTPHKLEAEVSYGTGSNRGGVVIRAKPVNIEDVQEPAEGDPGFNKEGIAFYPTTDGEKMIVQFTGPVNGSNTPVTRFQVQKPAKLPSLLERGILRIEDFDTTIYVYYNNLPFIRIELEGLQGEIYTSGTVLNWNMDLVGTFSDMEVPIIGKVSVAQRDATLRLYSFTINFNDLEDQNIQFDYVPKKYINDASFTISATASSGLPVEFKYISGPATLDGNIVTLTGEAGVVSIAANQRGNAQFYPAPQVIRSIYVSDPAFSNAAPNSQDYTDYWVATDALDRKLPAFEEAGPKRDEKTVGVFYYVWHGFHGSAVHDITKILAAYPENPLSNANPNWGGVSAFHFWGEPETGYHRAEDPWILRRDLQMLSNAHVDFLYIDVTNAVTYDAEIKALCEMSLQMRKEGIYTPEIAFCTNSKSGQIMNYLYDKYYSQSLFDELWFKWEGKPLILGKINDPELRPEVKEYFNIKYSWAWTNSAGEPNHWQWLDKYPQDYGWSTDPSIPEQIPVGVAEHPTHTHGKSFSNRAEPPVNENYLTEFTDQGLNFAEQWKRALEVDPPIVMVTQWNEWIAQRFIWDGGNSTYAGRPIKNGDTYFVDVFTKEFNRDIAPMKGGYTDNYYYQLVSNIRKYKGMAAPQEFSGAKTIAIDGDFSSWEDAKPVFRDPVGDVLHRNYRGYDAATFFVNTTGRNDILESKAAFDDNNLYFFAKTASSLTSFTDPNWMLLFIDADRNKGTGWEGYDYAVNLEVKTADETTVKQWDGIAWVNEIAIPYSVNNDMLEISIPRSAVMLDKDTPEFYFKWADNPQHLKDATCFFTEGEAAPDRRFNFNFSSTGVETKPQSPFKELTIPGTIEFEDFDNGGVGIAYADANIGNTGGAYRPEESVDIEEKQGGGFNLSWINTGEWLEYTVQVNAIGKFTASIHYAAEPEGKEATIYINGSDKSGIITFPSTGSIDTWATKQVEIQLTAGKKVLRFLVNNAAGDFKLDKIDFIEKDVVYPGNGNGLMKSFWTGSIGGREWFLEQICSEPDSVIDERWEDTGPGCDIVNDFWNVRWEGLIEPLYSEEYTFYLSVNDIGKLWINNQLVIDAWAASNTGKTLTGKIALAANKKVPIKVDFAEKSGDAWVKLEWSSPSNSREVIPMSQLYLAPSNDPQINQNSAVFTVYPNPAGTHFTIDAGVHEVKEINIIDLQGRTVFNSTECFTGRKTIDISFEKGIYLIQLHGSLHFPVMKLMVE